MDADAERLKGRAQLMPPAAHIFFGCGTLNSMRGEGVGSSWDGSSVLIFQVFGKGFLRWRWLDRLYFLTVFGSDFHCCLIAYQLYPKGLRET